MNQGYISAVMGLAGVAIGGLTSFFTTYFTQSNQLREHQREVERGRRERLYNDFIAEASRLFGDALSHEKDDVGALVQLYTLVARMRLVTSPQVVAAAERVMDLIIETYCAPNRSLQDLRGALQRGDIHFLRDFAEACRAELANSETPLRDH